MKKPTKLKIKKITLQDLNEKSLQGVAGGSVVQTNCGASACTAGRRRTVLLTLAGCPMSRFLCETWAGHQRQSKMLRSTTRQMLCVTVLTRFHRSEETQVPLLAIRL
jgi:hypothetical protein